MAVASLSRHNCAMVIGDWASRAGDKYPNGRVREVEEGEEEVYLSPLFIQRHRAKKQERAYRRAFPERRYGARVWYIQQGPPACFLFLCVCGGGPLLPLSLSSLFSLVSRLSSLFSVPSCPSGRPGETFSRAQLSKRGSR